MLHDIVAKLALRESHTLLEQLLEHILAFLVTSVVLQVFLDNPAAERVVGQLVQLCNKCQYLLNYDVGKGFDHAVREYLYALLHHMVAVLVLHQG